MPTYHRPGLYSVETLNPQNIPVNTTVAAAAIMQGALRGPLVPTLVQSYADIVNYYGGFTGVAANDVLVQALYDHIAAGGRKIYALRVAHADAAPATLPFAVGTGANAKTALNVTAANPGAWGNQIYVEILAGTTPDRFTLQTRLVPAGVTTLTQQQIVDRFVNVTLNPTDPRYVLSVVNSALNGSNLIRAAIAGGYAYTPGDALAASSVPGGSKLAGGADGSAVTSADLIAAVYLYDTVTQPLVMNVPGVVDVPTVTALTAYTDPTMTRTDGQPGRGDVFIVFDSSPGLDSDTNIGVVQTWPQSDFWAAYYPQVVVADPSSLVAGATKLVPQGPSVMGRYIATDATRGEFKAPAGTADGYLPNVLALDPAATLKNGNLDRMNDANVNAIKLIPNKGYCVFGARTGKIDYITRYINARRTLIKLRADLLNATAYAVFENNDSFLWADLFNACDQILRALFAARGLKGATPDQAYFVVCDSTNNTDATVAAGVTNIQIGVALQRPAEFVILNIGQTAAGASVTELTPGS